MILDRADVYLQEIDKSEVLPTPPPSTVAGMVYLSDKGRGTPTLIRNGNEFLSRCTRYGKPTDISHYTALKFLERSSYLYAGRALHSDVKYGGLVIKKGTNAVVTGTQAGPFDLLAGVYASGDNGGTGNTLVSWTAVGIGVAGNSITMTFTVAGNNTPLSIVVVGTDIDVKVGTGPTGLAVSTARQVSDALNSSAAASALITATYGGDGAGVVSALVQEPLAGGIDPTNRMKIKIDNTYTAEIALSAGIGLTAAVVAADIQTKIDLAIGINRIVVSADGTEHIVLTSVKYGTLSIIEVMTITFNAYTELGFTVGTTSGVGACAALTLGLTDPASYVFGVDELCLIYGDNPGIWDNDIGIAINNWNSVDYSFDISVHLKNDKDEVIFTGSTYTVSRKTDQKNEYGQNIFIETINDKSVTIKIRNNSAELHTLAPSYQETPLQMAQGSNGTTPTNGDLITEWDKFLNKASYPVTILLQAGKGDVSVQNKMLTVCETRLDCCAILDVPYGLSVQEAASFSRNDLKVDTSYGALFYDWLQDYDAQNDKMVYVPPSAYYGSQAAYIDSISFPWIPVAGQPEGVCRANGVRTILEDEDRATLEAANINPIRYKVGGIYIWGNDTLQIKESARSSLHVRRLLIYTESNILSFLESYEFKFNTESTRSEIKYNIEQFLAPITANQGFVEDPVVVCDETNNPPEVQDRREMYVDIYVKPTREAKYIILRVTILRTGASVEEVAA